MHTAFDFCNPPMHLVMNWVSEYRRTIIMLIVAWFDFVGFCVFLLSRSLCNYITIWVQLQFGLQCRVMMMMMMMIWYDMMPDGQYNVQIHVLLLLDWTVSFLFFGCIDWLIDCIALFVCSFICSWYFLVQEQFYESSHWNKSFYYRITSLFIECLINMHARVPCDFFYYLLTLISPCCMLSVCRGVEARAIRGKLVSWTIPDIF